MRAGLPLLFLTILCVSAAESRIDLAPLLEPHLEKIRVPAFAAAVVRGTNIIAAGVSGVRKAGTSDKVTLDDKFHIGSCTKSMTALIGALLDRSKVISLTNSAGEVLKDWKIPTQAHSITLEQLLQNRSGLGNDPDSKLWYRTVADGSSAEKQRRLFLESFLESPLEANPGSKYIYSNPGFALAGAMLEVASKTSWEDLVRQKIFSRLNLTSGGFGPPSTSGGLDQPWGHVWEEGRAKPVPPSDNPRAIAPAGAVHLSILDAARYAAFHLLAARGKIPALSSYRDALYSPPEGADYQYGMGWIIGQRKWASGKVLTHAGSNTMFFMVIWIAPERDFACVVATNVADRRNTIAAACDRIVGELITRFLPSTESK
jgi:CubicO group peptidase (beta-lactamase class C family)